MMMNENDRSLLEMLIRFEGVHIEGKTQSRRGFSMQDRGSE